jgi:hypothetical protein
MLKLKLDGLWSLRCLLHWNAFTDPDFQVSCSLFLPLAWPVPHLSLPRLQLESLNGSLLYSVLLSSSCLTSRRNGGRCLCLSHGGYYARGVHIHTISLLGAYVAEIENQHLSRRVTDNQIPAVPPHVRFSANLRKSLRQMKHPPSGNPHDREGGGLVFCSIKWWHNPFNFRTI